MPSHLILRCQSEDVVYWEEAKKTPHSRMPDSGSRTVCRHYLRGLCMKGGVRGIFQYFPQMVARWLKAQVSSDSGYQLWGTMFCLPINHSGLANFDSHPLILVNESLELLQTYGLTSFFMVGLHEKSIYRYIYIYVYHLLHASSFHPTSWTPTCVPCVKHAVVSQVTSVSIYINLIQIECQNVPPFSRSWPARGFLRWIFCWGSWGSSIWKSQVVGCKLVQ